MAAADATVLEQWPIEKLRPYDKNPRLFGDKLDKMVRAIRKFGFRVPVIARRNGDLAAGHFRLAAAKRIGLKTIPVIVAEKMTDAELKAFRIADNRLAEEADWDAEALISELTDLQEFFPDLDDLAKMTAFEQSEIQDLLTEEPEEPEPEDELGIPKKLGTKGELDVLAPGDDTEQLEDQSPIMEFRDDVIFDQVGIEGLPSIRKDMLLRPKDVPLVWAGPEYSIKDASNYLYVYMTESTKELDWKKTIIGFWTADKKFERLWSHTADIITRFKNIKIKGLVTPDFSTFHGWPRALRAYNVYRSRWIGRYVQEAGIPIVLNVSGTDLDMEYMFDGLPGGCPMAIELQARYNADEHKRQTEILKAVLEFWPDFLWVYGSQERLEQFPILRQKDVPIHFITPRMKQRREEFDARATRELGMNNNGKGA